jgi:hypothetical protein
VALLPSLEVQEYAEQVIQELGDRLTLLIHDGQCWQVQSEFALCQ